jgi:hypothetical protein
VTAAADPVDRCANCGRSFEGRFCPDCGQEARDLRLPLREVIDEFLDGALNLDARVWVTTRSLLTAPGKLAADYVAGRRARHVPPFKLYVFLSALFFAALALSDGGPLRFAATRSGEEISIVSAFGLRIGATGLSGATEGSIEAGLSQAGEDVDRLNDVVVATLSYAHFLLLPVLALLLRSMWRKRMVVEHLVFGTYFGAFTLLVGVVVVAGYALIGNPAPGGPAARVAIVLWEAIVAVMLYRALRDTYGSGRIPTAVRLVVLLVGYFVFASVAVVGITLATIRLLY